MSTSGGDISGLSSDEESEIQEKELDPSKVQFDFVKTGKSLFDGCLVTHNFNFKYHRQNFSRCGTKIW